MINTSYKPADFIVRKASDTAFGMKLVNGFCSSSFQEEIEIEPNIKDHIIVVGFVFSGKAVSKAAKTTGISYIIVESDPETVKQEKMKGERIQYGEKGERIQYGDAIFEAVLKHAGIKNARVLVIWILDEAAIRKIVEKAKELNPNVYIIAK